jgi:uncharacterized DUF497 family protein
MRFEWDSEKARSNQLKHGVSFEEASTVFGDSFAITFPDPDHSVAEERFVTFGLSSRERLVIVAHTERQGALRIISARTATKAEPRIYENG